MQDNFKQHLFSKKPEEAPEIGADLAWNTMLTQLNVEMPVQEKKKRRFGFWFWFAGLLIASGIGYALYNNANNNNANNNIATTINNKSSNKVEEKNIDNKQPNESNTVDTNTTKNTINNNNVSLNSNTTNDATNNDVKNNTEKITAKNNATNNINNKSNVELNKNIVTNNTNSTTTNSVNKEVENSVVKSGVNNKNRNTKPVANKNRLNAANMNATVLKSKKGSNQHIANNSKNNTAIVKNSNSKIAKGTLKNSTTIQQVEDNKKISITQSSTPKEKEDVQKSGVASSNKNSIKTAIKDTIKIADTTALKQISKANTTALDTVVKATTQSKSSNKKTTKKMSYGIAINPVSYTNFSNNFLSVNGTQNVALNFIPGIWVSKKISKKMEVELQVNPYNHQTINNTLLEKNVTNYVVTVVGDSTKNYTTNINKETILQKLISFKAFAIAKFEVFKNLKIGVGIGYQKQLYAILNQQITQDGNIILDSTHSISSINKNWSFINPNNYFLHSEISYDIKKVSIGTSFEMPFKNVVINQDSKYINGQFFVRYQLK